MTKKWAAFPYPDKAYAYDAAGLLNCSTGPGVKACTPLWSAETGKIASGSAAAPNSPNDAPTSTPGSAADTVTGTTMPPTSCR